MYYLIKPSKSKQERRYHCYRYLPSNSSIWNFTPRFIGVKIKKKWKVGKSFKNIKEVYSIPRSCDHLRSNGQNNKEKVSKKATKEQTKMKKNREREQTPVEWALFTYWKRKRRRGKRARMTSYFETDAAMNLCYSARISNSQMCVSICTYLFRQSSHVFRLMSRLKRVLSSTLYICPAFVLDYVIVLISVYQ